MNIHKQTRQQTGQLVIISGPPGIGKSTLARHLSRVFKLFLIDKDLIDEPFSPNQRGQYYSEQIEPKVLQSMFSLAQENIGLGHHVLLDFPMTHIILNTPDWIEKIRDLSIHQSPLIIELYLPETQLKERIRTRGFERDQVKLSPEGWDVFKKTDRLGEVNPLPHFAIDAQLSSEKIYQQASQFLQQNLVSSLKE